MCLIKNLMRAHIVFYQALLVDFVCIKMLENNTRADKPASSIDAALQIQRRICLMTRKSSSGREDFPAFDLTFALA